MHLIPRVDVMLQRVDQQMIEPRDCRATTHRADASEINNHGSHPARDALPDHADDGTVKRVNVALLLAIQRADDARDEHDGLGRGGMDEVEHGAEARGREVDRIAVDGRVGVHVVGAHVEQDELRVW